MIIYYEKEHFFCIRDYDDCGWPRKLDNLTWCKMPVKLTWKGRAFYEKVV